jgi:glucose-1-phosphate thymidylyltransferase
MKGIVLAGGTGSRLWPITRSVSKQLLPVYDKPMIYYPLSTLMLAGIREILIVTTSNDQSSFEKLLGDGSKFGITLSYEVQEKANGLAEALIIGERFLNGDSCCLILGDNIFHGTGLGHALENRLNQEGCQIFTYQVLNPAEYGIVTLDEGGYPISIVEKPKESKSNQAVTGLYFFDSRAVEFAKAVKPSNRGELEIISVIERYLEIGSLSVTQLSRGTAWLDTGNPKSLLNASNFIQVIESRTGLKIACLEEIAWDKKWISIENLEASCKVYGNSNYGQYLKFLINEAKNRNERTLE